MRECRLIASREATSCCYNYAPQSPVFLQSSFDYGDRFWDVKCRQFTCQCGSPMCKYSEEAYKKKAEQMKKGG